MRVVVAGTNFGRLYAAAVRADPRFTLAGILSRGSEFSRDYAAGLGVPHYRSVAALPPEVELVCVAVGSTVSGGEGTTLTQQLLERGIHVLQEHPVHATELAQCLRLARRHQVHYRMNTHYPQVAPVRSFVAAARRLCAQQPPLFVDAAAPVHVLLPLLDILARALGGLRPWRFDLAAAGGPLVTVTGRFAGVPLTLRVHNQLHPDDRDNHALLWHRVSIGTEGGVLALADTHGPALWTPRLHAGRDEHHRLVFEAAPAVAGEPATTVLPGSEPATGQEIYDRVWPEAIGRALSEFLDDIRAGGQAAPDGQRDLAITRAWAELTRRLGPPEPVRPPAPRPIAAGDLAPRAQPSPAAPAESEPAQPYSPSAEFFDLVAAPHVAGRSAPAVVAALSGVDPRHGPLVEVGAGTGLVTEAIARSLPDVEIIAAEPSLGMRAALTGRVYDDPDLRARVTVTAEAAPELSLPASICAAVVCGVAGHLDAAGRRRLWQLLAQRLPPGGKVVVELMSLQRPASLPPARLGQASAGEQSYEWWFAGEPATGSEELMRLRSNWRVFRGTTLVREVTDEYDWRTVTLDQIAAESGLALSVPDVPPGGTPIGVLTRTPIPEGSVHDGARH